MAFDMIKKCIRCKENIAPQRYAKNVRYCSGCRVTAYKYKEYRAQYQRARNDGRAKNSADKKRCLLCGLWYKKPLAHVWQRHNMNKKEYKRLHGLDLGRGILADSTKEKLQEAVKDNYNTVVIKNLIEKGAKTRFREGDRTLGKYERSKETLEKMRVKNRTNPSTKRL